MFYAKKFPEMNSMKSLLNRTQFEAYIGLADTKLTFCRTDSVLGRTRIFVIRLECGKSSSALKLFVWDFGSARVPADLYATLSMSVPRDYWAIVVCHTALSLSRPKYGRLKITLESPSNGWINSRTASGVGIERESKHVVVRVSRYCRRLTLTSY